VNIPLFKVFVAEDVTSPLSDVLQSGYIAQGPKVDEFEELLKEYTSTSLCAAVNSGTSALHLALHLIREQAGDRNTILTIPLTCTATNFPILANGYDIRWVDTDPATCNVDMQDLRRKLGPDVAGIMVVHWGGTPCDLDALRAVQDESEHLYGYRPPIIEDAAHAFGAEWDGKLLGNHDNFVMHSFQAIKHLTTGDGGVLISPDYEYHRRAKLLRWFGLDREKSPDMRCEQNVSEWGYKFHMNDINAVIGIQNFASVKEIVHGHRTNGMIYDATLGDIDGVTLLNNMPERCRSSYWIYTLRVERRDDFVKKLQSEGIACSRVHDRNDKHTCLAKYRVPLPGTDEVCSDMICIPCGWWVEAKDIDHIVNVIRSGW
jgi:dTDP-4-amino-4,6-dideoxygalactose transaminase